MKGMTQVVTREKKVSAERPNLRDKIIIRQITIVDRT